MVALFIIISKLALFVLFTSVEFKRTFTLRMTVRANFDCNKRVTKSVTLESLYKAFFVFILALKLLKVNK